MNQSSTQREQWLKWIGELVEQRISDEDFAKLEQVLQDQPQARRDYHRYVGLDVELGLRVVPTCELLTDLEEPAAKPAKAAASTAMRRPPRRSAYRGVLVAALVLLAFGLLMRMANLEPSEPATSSDTAAVDTTDESTAVAMISNMDQAVWGQTKLSTTLGGKLKPGRLVLESGTAQVLFDSGAVVDLVGPCQFRLVGKNRGELIVGRLSAFVPEQARRFTVDTPYDARVIDLGTQFDMQVDYEGSIDVQVQQGIVELVSFGSRRRIMAGQALAVVDGSVYAYDDVIGRTQSAAPYVKFTDNAVTPYPEQDGQHELPTEATIHDDGYTLQLAGNTWKRVTYPYEVTPNTVIELEFRTEQPGEIAAIGFDRQRAEPLSYGVFQLDGSEDRASVPSRYKIENTDTWQRVIVPVGRHYTGRFKRLLLVCDDDENADAEYWFRNIKVYEMGSSAADAAGSNPATER